MSNLIQLKLDDMRGTIPPVAPKCGCFIAGGAVRRWFTGAEPLSDVDVFSQNAEGMNGFIGELKGKKIDDTKNAVTYLIGEVRVQFIKLYRPTAQAVVDNFDFNVCQFIWTEQGIFATQEAIIGVLRGNLTVGKISKDFAVDSLRRAFKYQKKNFEPCWGTIRDIANSLRELTEEDIKNQIEQSPRGGSRIVRFD